MYYRIDDIRNEFLIKYINAEYVKDKTGVKVLELIGVSFIADEPYIFGLPNEDYISREIQWYESQSLNVNDIPGEIPKIWKSVATPSGEINSNYGWCIYNSKNYNQYLNVLEELRKNPYSRRAEMIYTRPSIWNEYNRDGMSDFICTEAVQYFIRDNKLFCCVKMRSNDLVHGYRNDWAWQTYILKKLAKDLGNIEIGDIIWQPGNIHIYEPHFYLVDHFRRSRETHITKAEYNTLYNKQVE